VDADWRSACLLYPDTLDYFFGLVEVAYPKERDEGVVRPELFIGGGGGGGGKRRIRRDSGTGEKRRVRG